MRQEKGDLICIGTGKGSWRRTAIAVQPPPDVFGAAFNPDFIVERSGEWSIMYEPSKLSLIPRGLIPFWFQRSNTAPVFRSRRLGKKPQYDPAP
jgi:hypothetical protein